MSDRSASSDVGWIEALTAVPAISAEQWSRTSRWVRWLVMTRASVLPLTLFSVLFAASLAGLHDARQWFLLLVTASALLLAHATNNLINDYVDHVTGIDKDSYFRTRYGVHVLESGLVSRGVFLRYLVATGLAAAALAAYLIYQLGGLVIGFALAGAFFVLFYTYPLKRYGLGEVAVLLTWGPLMVGGTYLVLTGTVTGAVLWEGLVYGLGPTVVIFAKHTDKAAEDRARRVYTLPMLLGAAPVLIAGLALLQLLCIALTALVLERYGWLVALAALPAAMRLWRVCQEPAPNARPVDYPESAWPLWFTTHAFVYARLVGLLLVCGALLQAIIGF